MTAKSKRIYKPKPQADPILTESESSRPKHRPMPSVKQATKVLELFPAKWMNVFVWQAGLMVILAFILYGNTLSHEFALDDRIVYTENKFVKEGIAGIPKILKYDTFLGYFGEKQENLLQGGRYRPLSLVTFAVEYEFFKDAKGKPNPFTGHLFNVLLYAGTLVFMLAFLRKILQSNTWAFIATLLFAVHPIHTEVVANIKSRDELMGLFFCIGAMYGGLYALIDWKRRWWALAAATISFALALLSKENALAYFVIFPFTFYYFGKGASFKTQMAFVTPFLLVIAFYGLFRYNMPGGIVTRTENENVMNDPFMLIPKDEKASQELKIPHHSYFSYKYGTIFYSLGKYVTLLFYPHPLSWDYGYPQLLHVSNDLEKEPHRYRTMGEAPCLLSFLLYVAIFGFAVWGLKKRTPVSWALWFYLFTIFIVSNIAVNIGGFLGERFAYQPSLGFVIVLSAGLLKLNEWGAFGGASFRKNFVLGLTGLLVVAGAGKTIARAAVWKHDDTLFLEDVKHCPNSAHTHKTAGGVYFRWATDSTKKLTTAEKEALLDTALNEYLESLRLYPQFPDAITDIVVVWRYVNPTRDAKNTRWAELLNYNFDYPWPHTNPQLAQKAFEEARANRSNPDFAIQKLQEALYYQPTNADYWYILGAKVYFGIHNYDQASRCFVKCTRLQPNNANYWHDLGVAYHNNHSYNEARQAFARCEQLDPNFATLASSRAKTEEQFKKEGKTYAPLPIPQLVRQPVPQP
jgi:tetratricopeptide (TPR) repeat protein